MKKRLFAIVSTLVLGCAWNYAAAQAQESHAQLSSSNSLISDINSMSLANCQPMKGERVAILDIKAPAKREAGGGVDIAKVRVLEGRCAGQFGWVGLPRLEKAQDTTERSNTDAYARLVQSGVLLSNKTDFKLADCQPMRGERVIVLAQQTDKSVGTDVARVQVVDGRCKGQEGWVGLPQLERDR